VLNRQREAIYGDRRRILEGDNLSERAQAFLEQVVGDVVASHAGEGSTDSWDLDALWTELRTLYPVSITGEEVLEESRGKLSVAMLQRELVSDAKVAYQAREDKLGAEAMRELERRVVLSVIDRRWRDHLYEMDYLKDGIGLRAMAQRDPLVEYQREGFAMFQSMMGQIREESVGFLFNLEVQVQTEGGTQVVAQGLESGSAPTRGLQYTAPGEEVGGADVEVRDERGRIDQAASARAAQRAAAQSGVPQPEPAPAQGGARGAFGQRTGEAAPQNRAQRRASERRGK